VEVYEEESCVSRGARPQNMGCGIGDDYQKKHGMFFETSCLLLSGMAKHKFPYKAKAPEHDTIVKRGFWVDHEKILCSYVHEACFKRRSF
jgi:hypothetical protein